MKKKPLKILVITSSFPQTKNDYGGIFVHRLNQQLQERGHTIETLTWRTPESQTASRFEPDYLLNRIPYALPSLERLFGDAGAPENLSQNPMLKLLTVPAVASMMTYALAAARDADLIIGHWIVPGGLIARTVGRLSNKPTFVVGHSGGVRLLDRSRAGRSLLKSICAGPTSFPNSVLAKRWETECLSMGFDTNGGLSDGTNDVLTLGRLVPIKGIDVVIRALAGSSLRLNIVGDGPLRLDLERLAEESGTNAIFHGKLVGDEKEKLLGTCRVFAMPSRIIDGRQEGLPVALLESMAHGITPIVSTFEGVSDITDATRSFDPEHWRASINSAHRSWSTDRASVTAASTHRYNWNVLGERWERLFQHVISASK